MLQEVEAAKKQMFDYKLQKFNMLLGAVFTRHAKRVVSQTFRHLAAHSRHLTFIAQKVLKVSRFSSKALHFRVWLRLFREVQAQREIEEYEREQQLIMIKEQTAENHRRR